MKYTYHPKVSEDLGRFGLRPRPTTPPALAKEFVNDLYRFELRQLRERHVGGEIPRHAYATHVVELRKKYILVSVPVRLWTQPAELQEH